MHGPRLILRSAQILCVLCLSASILAQQDEPSASQKSEQKDRSSSREAELSSSKDTRIDLSPPADDTKKHPESGAAVMDARDAAGDVQEFQAWTRTKRPRILRSVTSTSNVKTIVLLWNGTGKPWFTSPTTP